MVLYVIGFDCFFYCGFREVPVNEVQIEGGNCSNSIPRGKQEDCTNSETCDEQEQHRGQGDAPPNKS